MANTKYPVEFGGFASESLYVGDLDSNVNDEYFFELFNSFATIVSFQICRDPKRRGSSVCHAFVNYRSIQDAATVMKRLYFTKINGKTIRIMFSYKIPSIQRKNNANVYIKNLDSSIDNELLYRAFTPFGTVLSCKVAINENGKSKGHGFVQFEDEHSAQNAMKRLNNALINGKRVYVGPFKSRQDRIQTSPNFTNVYVKNLAETTTDENLKQLFGTYGTITSAVVRKDEDGKSKCFGYVNFENYGAAAAAVEKLNGTTFDGNTLCVRKARRKVESDAEFQPKSNEKNVDEKAQNVKLYVKNLDKSIDDEKLKELFSSFGSITSCKVMCDQDGLSRGFGFVAFSTLEEANRAVSEMDGRMIVEKHLSVAVAQRKEEELKPCQEDIFKLCQEDTYKFYQKDFHPSIHRYLQAVHRPFHLSQLAKPQPQPQPQQQPQGPELDNFFKHIIAASPSMQRKFPSKIGPTLKTLHVPPPLDMQPHPPPVQHATPIDGAEAQDALGEAVSSN